jgi:hypothetical protein
MSTIDSLEQPYLGAVIAAVRAVASGFRSQPASFLFEAEVQALLYTRLFDILAPFPLSWDPTGKGMPGLSSELALRLNPVKAEYPAGRRFDIAILAQETRPSLKAWSQPVRVGIELKLWQADQVTGARMDADRLKLERYGAEADGDGRRFTGLCIAFCHSRDDWRMKQWATAGDRPDEEERLVLPAHGVRTLVISAPTPCR